MGGSPFRLVRLTPAGSRLLDDWLAGRQVDMSDQAIKLQRRLLEAGLLHPTVDPIERSDVGFVIPVYDDPAGLAALLAPLRAEFPNAPIVVVDDASAAVEADRRIAASYGVTFIEHDHNRGPAAARNTGTRALGPDYEIVVFIDSDVEPTPDALALLLGHFDQPATVAVAPRVRARVGSSMIDRYEAVESPLDLGPAAAVVRPGSSVPYVPSAVLAVRRAALDQIGGFDESMRVGEDVDAIWRLLDAGGFVRFEPRSVARHRNRQSWAALGRQRHSYGTAAAVLDQTHPGDVAPIELSAQTLIAWALAWFAGAVGLVAGIGTASYAAFGLSRRLDGHTEDQTRTAIELAAMSHAHAGRWLARAVTRAWLPIFLLAAPFSHRARRALVAALLAPLVTWVLRRPNLDPISFIAARLFDDAAYCSGLWQGMFSTGNLRPLLPRRSRRSRHPTA